MRRPQHPARAAFVASLLMLASIPALARSPEAPARRSEAVESSSESASPIEIGADHQGAGTADSAEVPGQHNEVPEGTTADAFRIQAEYYAELVGVDLEEAMRRLELQGLVPDLSRDLYRNARDVLGGVRIEHEPEFHIVVSVVPGGEARVQPYIEASPLRDITTVETVERTEDELVAEQEELSSILEQLDIPYSSMIFGKEIWIMVHDAEEFMERVTEGGIELPDFVVVDDSSGPFGVGWHTEVPEASVEEAFTIHAEAYAEDVGVSVDEAKRRLELQGVVGELSAQLMTHERDVMNGIRIEHIPDLRVIIYAIPGGEERVRPYFVDGPLRDITTIEIVEYTNDQLLADLERANELLRPLGILYAASISVHEAQIFVVGAGELQQRLDDEGIMLPSTVKLYDVPYLGDEDDGG